MKTKILLITLLIIAANINTYAQPSIQWQKSLGGSGDEEAYSIQQAADGGYIVAGYSFSTDGDVTGNHGSEDYWIAKLNSAGGIQWQKSLGGTSFDVASSIQQTADSGYIIAGYSLSTNGDVTGNHGGSFDYWIVKLDSAGSIRWQKSLGGTGPDYANSVQQTRDGGYIVAGNSSSTDGDVTGNHGSVDCWIVKLDTIGNIKWQKSLGGTLVDNANSIQQTSDGGYIVAGGSDSNDGNVTANYGNSDYWIVKLDSGGSMQWQKSFGGSDLDEAYSIQQTTDGGYIVAGASYSTDSDITNNHGGGDYWIVKLDSAGIMQWQKSLGGTNDEEARSIQQTSDGGYIVAGYSLSNDGDVTGHHGTTDYEEQWIVKLDSTGNIKWQKSLGGTADEYAYSIHQTTDGGYIIAGSSNSSDGDVTGNHGGSVDYWIVKLSPDLCSAYFTINADTNQLHHYLVTNLASGVQPLSYDWSWGDGIHDTIAFPTHIYADSGFYNICLSITDSTGCQSTFCDSSFHAQRTTNTMVYITVLNPLITGMQIITSPNPQVTIYPNPFTLQTTIVFSEEQRNTIIKITDLLGKEINVINFTGKQLTIEKGEMSNGIYFVQITDDKKNVVNQKIVVQ